MFSIICKNSRSFPYIWCSSVAFFSLENQYLRKDSWNSGTIEVNVHFQAGHGTDAPNPRLSREFRDSWHLWQYNRHKKTSVSPNDPVMDVSPDWWLRISCTWTIILSSASLCLHAVESREWRSTPSQHQPCTNVYRSWVLVIGSRPLA